MQVMKRGRLGNRRADEGSGSRCEDGWGSEVMGKVGKVKGHLVDGWKMAMKRPGELGM